MKTKIILYVIWSVCFLDGATAQKVGLVLSGGGAKGAAHIGVIKALEENNVPIDYIAGTSIGAIVGSLYAMGYTPDEMLELMLSDKFGYWYTGTVEKEYVYYYKKPEDTPQFMRFSLNLKDSTLINGLLPSSLINPIQINQAVVELFAQATAHSEGDFDRLFVPFRCISSDIYGKKVIISRDGDLGNAVRASMTFPFFFKPIWKDGVPLFDGGIYNNFPVDVMKSDFAPDFIFGSMVRGGGLKPSDNPMNQIETMILQKMEYTMPEEDGIMLEMRMPEVFLFDFSKAKEVMRAGYERALAEIGKIKARVGRETPLNEITERRKAYKAALPPLKFKRIDVNGATDAQRTYIITQLTRDVGSEFTMEDFRRAYFKMLTHSKIEEIIPTAAYNREDGSFDLHLDVKIKDEIAVSIGGNISSHQANQLFLGLEYQSLGETSADYNAHFQMGNSFSGASIDGRFFISAHRPGYLGLKLAYSNKNYSQNQSLFYEDIVPAFIKRRERFLKTRYGFPFMMSSKVELFAGYGVLNDLYYQTTAFADLDFDVSRYELFNVGLKIERNSLDFKQYPTAGLRRMLSVQYISGSEDYKKGGTKYYADVRKLEWLQLKGVWQHFPETRHKFRLGYMGEAAYSNRPFAANYTASIIGAPSFAPTPHSKIAFNEAFRANAYVAAGIMPVWKFNDMLQFRLEAYGFAPLQEIRKGAQPETTGNYAARYGDYFKTYRYMGEAALSVQLPFVSVSLFVNGYSYPKNNYNIGLNIGYLIFDSGFFD